MTQSLLDTVTPLLKEEGLFCIRTGNGRETQFWSSNYGDLLTIRVKPDSAALVWTITFKNPSEKSHPMVLKREDGTNMSVSSLEEFLKVKDTWVARVKQGC